LQAAAENGPGIGIPEERQDVGLSIMVDAGIFNASRTVTGGIGERQGCDDVAQQAFDRRIKLNVGSERQSVCIR
jgi:hypothetical protein